MTSNDRLRLELKWERHRLENGLTVLLHEDAHLPMVTVNLWYHVGSKNEVPGRTGFAHLFEHMMFQGSEHSPDEYFKPLEEIGSQLNGSTSEDRTNYWETVPREYLDRALFMESDRMGFLLPALDQAKLDNQREVVKNERRETLENQPYGVAEEALLEALYPPGHPYHHSVIGSMADLDAATLEDVHRFFKAFYTPNNASLCVAGDIDRKEALDKVRAAFGEIAPGPVVSPLAQATPRLSRPERLELEDRVQLPRLYLQWPVPPQLTREDAALSLLGHILQSEKDSRLVKRLQVDGSLAQSVWAFQRGMELTGQFHVIVTAQPERSLGEIEAAVWEEIRAICEKGPTPEEVEAAQAAVLTRACRRLQRLGGFGGVCDLLNYYQTMTGDPGYLNADLERYASVTADDVREAARRHLTDDGFVGLSVVPQRKKASSLDRSRLPGPGKRGTFRLPEIDRRTLDNGMEVWIVPKRGLPLVSLEAVVRAGVAHDPEGLPGMADIAADMVDEGAAGQDVFALAGRLKSMGTHLSTDVSRDAASFDLTLLSRHVEAGIGFLADILMRPEFRQEDLDRVRQDHLADLIRGLDDPEELGQKALRCMLYGPKSAYGHPADGTPDSLKRIAAEDLRAFHSGRYRPERCLLILTGDVEADAAFEFVREAFGGWRAEGEAHAEPEDPETTVGNGLYLVPKAGAPQSFLIAARPAMRREDPAYAAFVVFNAVLGGLFTSRVNMNLREDKGYTYGARSGVAFQKGVLPWVFSSAVQADKSLESLHEAEKEVGEILSSRPVTEREFEDARSNMVLKYPQRFETLPQLATGLGSIWIHRLPPDFHERILESLETLTLDDVQAAGRRVLDPGKLLWVLVGDEADLGKQFDADPRGLEKAVVPGSGNGAAS